MVTCRVGAKNGPVSRIYIGEAVLVRDGRAGTVTPPPDSAAARRFAQVWDGSGADVAVGGCWLPGNDWSAAVNLRAVFPISVSAGGVTGRAGCTRPARHQSRGHPGWKGGSGLMRCRYRFLLAGSRRRPQALGRAQPDLTAGGEPGVDAAGPGRQASTTCPPVCYLATPQAAGRSAPTTTARDHRWPPGRPRLPSRLARPGVPGGCAGRCLPRQAGRTVTRQVAWPPRPAGAPAGRGEAVGAGQRRNVPAGVNRD